MAKRSAAGETACGDDGIIKEFGSKVFIGIIDAEGHGKKAEETALSCKDFLEKNYHRDLVEMMDGLHQHIKGFLRGAVAGLGVLNLETGELVYVGVGNTTARAFGSTTIRLIPRNGIVGYMMSSLREEKAKLHDGDVLLLHTDGVKEHFDLEDYPGMLRDDAETIATRIIKRFGRQEDDVCCIVLRYRR